MICCLSHVQTELGLSDTQLFVAYLKCKLNKVYPKCKFIQVVCGMGYTYAIKLVVVYLKRKFNECSVFYLATQTQGNPLLWLAGNKRFPRMWDF